jgi:hypothetical protein
MNGPASGGLAGRLRELSRELAAHTWITVTLRLIAAAVIILVVTPRPDRTEMSFPQSMIDTVAREGIVATHDFNVEDISEAELLEIRQSATLSAPQVWERDENASDQTVERLREVAQDARVLLAEEARARFDSLPERPASGGPDAAATEGSVEDGTIYAGEIAQVEALSLISVDERVSLLQQADIFASLVGSEGGTIPDGIRRTLARDAFSAETVEAVIYQLLNIQRQDIVDDGADAPPRTDGPVVIRDRNNAVAVERGVDEFQRVSLREVRSCPQRILTLPTQVSDGELLYAVQRLACLLAAPNVTFDIARSGSRREDAWREAAQQARSRSVVRIRRGEILVQPGQVITPQIHRRLEQMAATREAEQGKNLSWLPVTLYMVFMLTSLAIIGRRWLGRQLRPRDELMMLLLIGFQLGVTRLIQNVIPLWDDGTGGGAFMALVGWAFLVPYMGGPMLVRMFRPLESAIFVAVAYAALALPLVGAQPGVGLIHVLGGITAAVVVGQGRLRRDTVVAPLAGVLVSMLPLLGLLSATKAYESIPSVGALLALVLGSLVVNSTLAVVPQPLVEGLFGMTSAARLKELGQEHTLLDQLARQAGGTYSHSRMVGELCRSGCEAIGANSLLAEVGARFHDIGKLKRPEYFAENQRRGENVHDSLEPLQSAAILREHISYGIELAIQHGLPDEIIAFIREHHGTKLMGFYGKALKQGEAFEADFRYEGPCPASRETAICLLADGIEAESRSKPRADVNEEYISALIKRHIRDAVSDGQLVDSGLSMRELYRIEQAFQHSMSTELLQKRPEYDKIPRLDESDQLKVRRLTDVIGPTTGPMS